MSGMELLGAALMAASTYQASRVPKSLKQQAEPAAAAPKPEETPALRDEAGRDTGDRLRRQMNDQGRAATVLTQRRSPTSPPAGGAAPQPRRTVIGGA